MEFGLNLKPEIKGQACCSASKDAILARLRELYQMQPTDDVRFQINALKRELATIGGDEDAKGFY